MALTEEQRNPWRAIVAGGDYNLTSQDWEDLLTELDSLYTESPIAQPASAPSEQKPEYTREIGEAAERYFNSFGLAFNVRTPATFRYSKLWDAMADAAYTAPQSEYKEQRDAERWRYARRYFSIEDIELWQTEMKGHQPSEEENVKADSTIDAAIASAKGGA